MAFIVAGPPPPIPVEDSIPQEVPGLTKAQACQILADLKPSGCSLENFEAAPGFPSPSGSWVGNGCGSDPLGNFAAIQYLGLKYGDDFSDNLDTPLADYPNVSFLGVCNAHDGCYTTRLSVKTNCDQTFGTDAGLYCRDLGPASELCTTFANEYSAAFETDASQVAYDAGQSQAMCAQWATAMQDNGCEE